MELGIHDDIESVKFPNLGEASTILVLVLKSKSRITVDLSIKPLEEVVCRLAYTSTYDKNKKEL